MKIRVVGLGYVALPLAIQFAPNVIVLARYMQILPAKICEEFYDRIIRSRIVTLAPHPPDPVVANGGRCCSFLSQNGICP